MIVSTLPINYPKYTHHITQNELLNIMASHVLRAKLSSVRDRKFFTIMADEGTDISNIEQLSFCTRSVDDDLNVSEDFMGYYELKNIKSETIINAIKDILVIYHLSLENCRGQTYDGASNMMGKRSSVSVESVESVLLYNCNTWTLTKQLTKKIDGVYTRMLRKALNVVSWKQHLTNADLYGKLPPVSSRVAMHHLRLADDTGLTDVHDIRNVMMDRKQWKDIVRIARSGDRPK